MCNYIHETWYSTSTATIHSFSVWLVFRLRMSRHLMWNFSFSLFSFLPSFLFPLAFHWLVIVCAWQFPLFMFLPHSLRRILLFALRVNGTRATTLIQSTQRRKTTNTSSQTIDKTRNANGFVATNAFASPFFCLCASYCHLVPMAFHIIVSPFTSMSSSICSNATVFALWSCVSPFLARSLASHFRAVVRFLFQFGILLFGFELPPHFHLFSTDRKTRNILHSIHNSVFFLLLLHSRLTRRKCLHWHRIARVHSLFALRSLTGRQRIETCSHSTLRR